MKKLEISVKNVHVPLLYEYDNSLPVGLFRIVFKTSGKVAEKIKGVARVVSNMLEDGTLSLPGAKFAKFLEIKAVELSVSAGFETFVIEFNSLKEHFGFALDKFDELLCEPNFSEECLKKVKFQTISEIKSLKTEFDYVAQNALNELLYTNGALSYPLIGDEKSVEKISLENVREFFEILDLKNTFVVVCGDIDLQKFTSEISKILENLPVGKKRELPVFRPSSKKQTKILKEKSEQAFIYFGAPYDVNKDERYKANVAMNVLGSSGFGTRLMESIRVKNGLAYSAYARANLNLSHNQISGYLQTKNENYSRAIKLVKKEFANFVENGISQKELENTKKFLLGSAPLQKETMFKRLKILQNEYYSGMEFGEFERNLQKIADLKLSEINDFISAHSEISDLSFASVCGENFV